MIEHEKEIEFNPTMFGFEVVDTRRKHHAEGDYILRSNQRARNAHTTTLSLSEETAAVVTDMFGDTVSVAFNKSTGCICIYKGISRKVSPNSRNGDRCTISLGVICNDLEEKFGDFFKVPVTARIWGGGQAILFTPDNEAIK